jgi:hypothetical protein
VRLEEEGHSLMIVEGPELRSLPDRILVTIESIAGRVGEGSEPVGPPVVRWPAQ